MICGGSTGRLPLTIGCGKRGWTIFGGGQASRNGAPRRAKLLRMALRTLGRRGQNRGRSARPRAAARAPADARGDPLSRRAGDGIAQIAGIVLRYGAFYGRGTGLFAPMIDRLRRRRVPLIGAAQGWWSFLHIDDAAAATARDRAGRRRDLQHCRRRAGAGPRMAAGAGRDARRQAAAAGADMAGPDRGRRAHRDVDDRGARRVERQGETRISLGTGACLVAARLRRRSCADGGRRSRCAGPADRPANDFRSQASGRGSEAATPSPRRVREDDRARGGKHAGPRGRPKSGRPGPAPGAVDPLGGDAEIMRWVALRSP